MAEVTEPHPDQPDAELPEDEAELAETLGGDELTEREANLAVAQATLTGDLSPGGAVGVPPADRRLCGVRLPVLRANEASAPGSCPESDPGHLATVRRERTVSARPKTGQTG